MNEVVEEEVAFATKILGSAIFVRTELGSSKSLGINRGHPGYINALSRVNRLLLEHYSLTLITPHNG